MKSYDKVCPICGTLNRNLNLDETDGWMECEACGHTVGFPLHIQRIRVPVYNLTQIAERVVLHPANIKGSMAQGTEG